MSKVELIEQEIGKLSSSELAAFRDWFAKFDAKAWDSQIKEDSQAGKLDALANEALQAFRAGRCSEL